MKASDRAVLVFAAVAILLVLALLFLRLPLIETCGHNPDELEHLHWSWCVWRGLVPYVDYFDHHTPWLHFFLVQFFDFYDVERLPEDALGFTFIPWETTFDGFTGLGMFRPQPFFHHFQHPHAFVLQSKEEHKEMYEALRSGRAAPKFIFWSHYLRDAVTPEITAFLEEHYVPTGLEPIRVRPFDNGVGWWSDEKTRYIGWVSDEDEAPHVLFDDEWRPPSEEFGLPIRRARTRRSTLTVPIRYPRDFTVTLRAHADPEFVPFGVELVVNRRSAGLVDAVPRWQDYAFPVTVHQLRPGFNELELRFNLSAENEDPSKRLELAVHSLNLTATAREEAP